MSSWQSVDGPILAIDPGKDKCGVAVVARDGRVLERAVVATAEIVPISARLVARHQVTDIVLGDRTAAKDVAQAVAAGIELRLTLVDEHRSSEQARRRFFRENPPRGWRRLLPVTLLTPDRPYDDYVAVLLAERYLASRA